jgi:hypothetical protein
VPLCRVRLLEPPPRSIESQSLVVPSVIVLLPVPVLTRVWTLSTVPLLLTDPSRVSLLLPEPRSMVSAVVSAVPRVMTSLADPASNDSTLDTVTVLAPLFSVRLLAPPSRSTEPLVSVVP